MLPVTSASPHRHSWPAVIVLFFSSCLWGLSWWPLKALAERGLSGIPLILIAYGSVALLLLPVLWKERAAWRSRRQSLWLIMGLGGIANLAFTSSLTYGEVIRVMALFYLLPVWGMLGGWWFLGETLTKTRLLALALALTGAFQLLGGTAILDAPPHWIDMLAILSGMAFAANNLVFRATPTLPIASKVGWMFAGSALMAALLLAAGVQTLPSPRPAPDTLGYAILFGIGGLLLATGASQWAVTHLEAGRAAIIMVMELVSAVVSAALILHASLTPGETVGAALILLATLVEAISANGSTNPPANTPSSRPPH